MARGAEESGFTLVELLMVMVVLGIISATVAMLTLQATRAYANLLDRRDNRHHARLSLERVAREVRQASALGLASGRLNVTTTRPAGCSASCDVVSVFRDATTSTVRVEVNGLPAGGTTLAQNVAALTFNIENGSQPNWVQVDLTDGVGLKYRTKAWRRKGIFYPN